MQEEESWNWIDEALMRAPLPYPVISLFIGIIIYLIYAFFYFDVIFLEPYWDNRGLTFIMVSAAIAYQIAGIRFLLKKVKTIFLEFSYLDENEATTIYGIMKYKFKKSYWYYVLLPLVILPFYLIDFIRGLSINEVLLSESSYHKDFIEIGLKNPQIAEFIEAQKNILMAYDVYSNLIGIFFLILLSTIVWIIFSTTWGLSDVGMKYSNINANISIFSLNAIMIDIRSDILKIIAYYFICIAMAILSYPFKGYLTFEVAFLLILLLLGVMLFLVGIEAIQSIMKAQAKFELDEINEKSKKSAQKLISIASEEDYSDKEAKIKSISEMLDILQKERERVTSEAKGYGVITILTFAVTLLIPLLSFMEKYWPKIAPILQDNSTLLNLSQIIPK